MCYGMIVCASQLRHVHAWHLLCRSCHQSTPAGLLQQPRQHLQLQQQPASHSNSNLLLAMNSNPDNQT